MSSRGRRVFRSLALAGAVALTACGCAPDMRPAVSAPPWIVAAPAAWQPNAGPLWRPMFPTSYSRRPPGEDAWQFGDYAKAVALEDAAIRDAEGRHATPQAQD